MAHTHQMNSEQKKVLLVENMWLHHYNNTLLAKKLITEAQHRKMSASINSRVPSTTERA